MAVASLPPSEPAPTPWRLIILLGALTAFAPMAIDMYLPAMTSLQADLGATPQQTQVSMSIFFAGMAIGQFIYGPASDRFGRRTPILIGIAIYIAGSVACALATSAEMLIAARLVQALGGCAGGVVARAVVRDRFDHQDTARMLSLLTLIMGLAPIFAPSVGNLVLLIGGWRAIFGVLTAFGVAIGLWALVDLKESRSDETAAHARSENVLKALATLSRQPRLIGYALAAALNGAMLFTYISASPDLVMGTYGVSPIWFGFLFSLNAIAVIGGSQVNRLLLRRLLPDQVLARAALTAVAGAVVLAFFAFTGLGGPWTVLPSIFLVLSSYGFMQGNTMAGALNVDPKRAGSISALMGGAAFGAGAVVASLTGLLHDGTARPLAGAMLLALIGSALSLYLLAFRKTEPDPS